MPSTISQVLALKRNRNGKMPRLRKPPRQATGKSLERSYQKKILGILDPLRTLIIQQLLPAFPRLRRMAEGRIDVYNLDVEPWVEELRTILGDIQKQFNETASPEVRQAARRAAADGNIFNERQVRRQFKAVLGVDLFAQLPNLQEDILSFIDDNVGLITSINTRYFTEIEGAVLRGFRGGQRVEDLSTQILHDYDVTRSRANLIARDQTAKLQGDMTRRRQMELGVKKYIWRTSRDERVRAGHAKLEGTIQNWNDPPIVDAKRGRRAHPGQDFQCRCTAEPVLDDLL